MRATVESMLNNIRLCTCCSPEEAAKLLEQAKHLSRTTLFRGIEVIEHQVNLAGQGTPIADIHARTKAYFSRELECIDATH